MPEALDKIRKLKDAMSRSIIWATNRGSSSGTHG